MGSRARNHGTQHTPGPWAHADEADPIGHRIVVWSVPTAAGVAHAFTLPDARLIAAAPALADALEKCANLTRLQRESPQTVRQVGEKVGQIAREALRTAGRLP